MSRVTVIDVLETGACIDGVLKFVADHAGRIECDSAEFPHEAQKPNAEWTQENEPARMDCHETGDDRRSVRSACLG